jgi:hypothetical protein
MTPRRRRIGRILDHRQKELDGRVGALVEVRAREARAVAEAEAADQQARAAEASRRELAERGSDAATFLEAEEWLSTTARRAHRAWSGVLAIREEIVAVQATVLEARMKLKQAEQLASRVAAAERLVDERRERRRDDEDAARIAQRRTGVAGDE